MKEHERVDFAWFCSGSLWYRHLTYVVLLLGRKTVSWRAEKWWFTEEWWAVVLWDGRLETHRPFGRSPIVPRLNHLIGLKTTESFWDENVFVGFVWDLLRNWETIAITPMFPLHRWAKMALRRWMLERGFWSQHESIATAVEFASVPRAANIRSGDTVKRPPSNGMS